MSIVEERLALGLLVTASVDGNGAPKGVPTTRTDLQGPLASVANSKECPAAHSTFTDWPGKIAVDPTGGEESGENEMNPSGQLGKNAGTAPSGPAMLNGQKVTSANLNQKTPKKAATATATPLAAATTATAPPTLVTAQPAGAAQTLVTSAMRSQTVQQQAAGGQGQGMMSGGGGAGAAAQFVQKAPAAAGNAASRSGQLRGSVTSVSGGRRMMLVVTPLRVISP
ncbi:hypothetical protein COCSUDRAFT_45020 [Coccomyxa subellipsoidea C-169]|uniref:Uncharacterized protein n=1 Tax=Coccomyxa subellipsoidea (strain C-169) TaxID=574566 RepID=I0YKE5_COCSC|nr:hypothetical protein COCSUDRAFT_45020 [Coccomyxa subellipsoidea C-169]EIE18864.1 hypothetical protein COCSUDRAFT_45020 [Coccomyxa subellipsoidea C-169]|eukprot:XP_005643408.1 hypothetical protein COCSUDRAFT_45020 [Coccomyxa subellipsoidea C-169]